MKPRTKWTIVGAPVVVLAALALVFQGEIAILIANQRPDVEGARLSAELGIDGTETVAEIGAGAGHLTVAVARRLPRGRMYSTELGDDNIDALRDEVSKAGLGNIEVRAGASRSTNLPDACCDAIFMRTVYHHLTNPPEMIRSLHAGLKPGGRLAIIEFEPNGLWRFFAPSDVPDRGGHGVPKQMLVDEVTAGRRFQRERQVDDWIGPLYLIVFRRV
jgi:ubiquinone/menaquinone biosynthesis C-methylase UbiE